MNSFIRWIAGTLLILPAASAAAAELEDTIARIRPSIVAVGTFLPIRRPPSNFLGTGFAVGDGRHVITNAHVLPAKMNKAKKETLAVFAAHGSGKVHRARLLGADRVHDIALLAIDGKLPPMALGNQGAVREGRLYAFTGFPIGPVLGLYPVTHRGIVSAITPIAIPQLSARSLDREMIRRLKKPYLVFQLDATAYPGNSGSPLYEAHSGAVVGVINKVFIKKTKEKVLSDPSGITYAIPVEHVRKLMRKHRVSP